MTTIYHTYMKSKSNQDWKICMPSEVSDIGVLESFFELTEAEVLAAIENEQELTTTWMGVPQIFKIVKEEPTPVVVTPPHFEDIVNIAILGESASPVIILRVTQNVGTNRGTFTLACPTNPDNPIIESVTSNSIDLPMFTNGLMELVQGEADELTIPFGIMFQADGLMRLAFTDNVFSVTLFTGDTEVAWISWKEVNTPSAFDQMLTKLIIAFPVA